MLQVFQVSYYMHNFSQLKNYKVAYWFVPHWHCVSKSHRKIGIMGHKVGYNGYNNVKLASASYS